MVQSRRRAGTVLVTLILASLLLLALASVSQGQTSEDSAAQTPDNRSASSEQSETSDLSQLLRKAEQEGSVRVIVRLRTDFVPEGRLDRPEVADQRAGIQSARAGLQEDLRGTNYQTVREFETVPFVALEASPRALEAIQSSPLVTDVVQDRLDEAYQDKSASKDLDSTNLAESTPLVQAPTMWANGFTGSGQVVAVLDTGVDSSHPFFGDRVVEEACYTANRSTGSGNCPNGTATQTGPGSGVHCTYAPSACRHGTHVAGIAAGQGSSFSGVTVSGMLPKPGSTTTDTTPTIKATVKDNMTNLQKGNIKLYVNGSLISATKYSYSAATDVLVYNSPKLAKGKKMVKIVARDAAGNVGAKSWYFTIK